MSQELLTLLHRIQKTLPPTEEPPKPSQALTQLLSVMDARRRREESERDLFHRVKEQRYEIAMAKHILNCDECQLELQLAVERYMGHMRGPWYLDLVNDVGGLDPNCPQVENYRFGNYWDNTEGQYDTIQFIRDRTSWAMHILREEYVESIRMLRALRRERRVNMDVPYLGILFPNFWGEELSVVLEKEAEEDPMYECRCCKSMHSKKDYPPIAGMCPECHKFKENALVLLYHDVERPLTHLLQPVITLTPGKVSKIRDDLRKIMREIGWVGPF